MDLLQEIKKDKELKDLLDTLTEEQINDNLLVLFNQHLQNEKCAKCLGKLDCLRDEENMQSYLVNDNGILRKKLKDCPYKDTYNFDLLDILYMPTESMNGSVNFTEDRSDYFSLVSKYMNGETDKGIYLYGKFGTGKSFLIFQLALKLAKSGKRVAYAYYPELARNIKNNVTVYGYVDNVIKKLKNVDVLILDDLGGETNSAYLRDDILQPILQYRMLSKLPVFVTSNLDIKSLNDHFANERDYINDVAASRVIERICALCNVLELKGKNYRE